MIILGCAIWFTILYLLVYRHLGSNDSFGPVKLLTTKMIIMNIPFLFFIALYPETFDQRILYVVNSDINDAFFKYTIVQTICFISLVGGVKLGEKKVLDKGAGFFKIKVINYYNIFALIFFLLGVYTYVSFLNSVGGLMYLLSNLSNRTELLNEGGGTGNAVFYLTFSIILLLFSYSRKKNVLKLVFIIIQIILTILIFSSMGGRKNTLYLVLFIIGSINYYLFPFKLKNISKKYLIIFGLLVSTYILIIPFLRQKDGFEKLTQGETSIVEIFEIESLITSVSYTYIDVFAANYFNSTNFWYLSSSNDILLNIEMLGSDKSLRPPIDDGVYFRSMVDQGSYLKPPVGRGKLYESSWPIEHFGFSFANLGIFGIILFSLILGYIYSITYRLFLFNKMEPVFLYLYIFIIFNFNFSNLRIVQFLSILPLFFIYIIFARILQKK